MIMWLSKVDKAAVLVCPIESVKGVSQLQAAGTLSQYEGLWQRQEIHPGEFWSAKLTSHFVAGSAERHISGIQTLANKSGDLRTSRGCLKLVTLRHIATPACSTYTVGQKRTNA